MKSSQSGEPYSDVELLRILLFFINTKISLYHTTNHNRVHRVCILKAIYRVFYLPHGQNRCINNRHSCGQSCAVYTAFGHCALVPVLRRASGNGNVKHCLPHPGIQPRSIVQLTTTQRQQKTVLKPVLLFYYPSLQRSQPQQILVGVTFTISEGCEELGNSSNS